ncbi:hypothetical protein [Paenibacillus sp. FSL R10-2734]|uniref:hypothetical protein n=1 Tax=Paenibacillus sp. FSL R10-2734 TaxID=2954691 RepID=UPI0030D9B441
MLEKTQKTPSSMGRGASARGATQVDRISVLTSGKNSILFGLRGNGRNPVNLGSHYRLRSQTPHGWMPIIGLILGFNVVA